MHSRIYQVSNKPIPKREWATPDDFYENSDDFADYIGDKQEGDARKEDIRSLAKTMSELFDLDKSGNALVYKGGLEEFCKKWADAIHDAAKEVTAENVIRVDSRYNVRMMCKETHLESSCRFSIVDYQSYAGPMSDLVKWIFYGKMKPGAKVFIGAVIDYHW